MNGEPQRLAELLPGVVADLVARHVVAHQEDSLSEIAAENLGKLLDRQARGVLGGSGDHR